VIVVDTNIIAYSLIEGEHTTSARALWRGDPEWRLPVFWQYEFLNVLSTYTRRRGIELEQAERLWETARRWCEPMERQVNSVKALQLSTEQDISAYDSQFVALAQSLSAVVVSEDVRLQKRCPATVVSSSSYLSC